MAFLFPRDSCITRHGRKSTQHQNVQHHSAHYCRRLSVEGLEPRILLTTDLATANSVAPAWFTSPVEADSQSVAGQLLTDVSVAQSSRWIVQLTPDVAARAIDVTGAAKLLTDLPVVVHHGLGQRGLLLVEAFGDDAEVEALLTSDSRISHAVADSIVSGQRFADDPQFEQQDNLQRVNAEGAWDSTIGSTQTVTGVIDTGIDLAHPDLYLNIWINQNEIPLAKRNVLDDFDNDGLITFYDLNDSSNSIHVLEQPGDDNNYVDALDLLADPSWSDGLDTDLNGFVDDFFGWNFRSAPDEPFAPNNPSDVVGHGTHVAGVIGATAGDSLGGDSSTGVAGLNWRTSLMSLKFLDASLQGNVSDAIRALNYATMMRTEFNTKIRATNNSWGQTGGFNPLLRDAIEESGDAGMLFVAASGNGNVLGQPINNDQAPFYPASYELPNIVSVAASNANDDLALFSNFGVTSVDIAAPGVGVLSTVLGDTAGGDFATANGTSMATPHVTGAAALVWSLVPGATVAEVRQALLDGADPVASLAGSIATGGRLDVERVMEFDGFAPSARLFQADDITTAGGATQTITIEYTDPRGLDETSFDANDIVVERQWGPRDTFVPFSAVPQSTQDDRVQKVIYTIAAPGSWDPLDFGDYRITLREGEVTNDDGVSAGEAVLGEFRVQIEDPAFFYVNSLSDGPDANLGDGVAETSNGTTTLRAAVGEANVAGAPRTIILDSGEHLLDQQIIGTLEFEAEPNDSLAEAQDLEASEWTIGANPNVENSDTTAYLSVQGTGDGTFDYYAFDVPFAGSIGTFDMDATTFDTELFLFDSGGLVDFNDDLLSIDPGSTTDLDSFLTHQFAAPGRYVIGVGRFNSDADEFGIFGDTPRVGDSYTLHVSIEGHDATVVNQGDLDISGDVTILGDSPTNSIVNAGGIDRVFDVGPSASLTLQRVQVTGGVVTNEGGGGIRSQGDLVLLQSLVTENQIAGSTSRSGGGIEVAAGTLDIFESTISGNQNVEGSGGGISVGGAAGDPVTATIRSSTVDSNLSRSGGGFYVDTTGLLFVTNSTISGNQAPQGPAIDGMASDKGLVDLKHTTVTKNISGFGMAVIQSVDVVVANSIVADNSTAIDDIEPQNAISFGGNLFGRIASPGSFLTASDHLLNQGEDLLISPLQDNGGPTLTHLPLPGSRAIDAATFATTLPSDQTGLAPRSADGDGDGNAVADIGATERIQSEISGTLFDDLNRNGQQEGTEPGLGGRTVFLDQNRNGLLDEGELSTTTLEEDPTTLNIQEAGRYEFRNLPPGDYWVTQLVDPAWEATIAGRVETTRVSLLPGGSQSTESVFSSSIDSTGQFVVFSSLQGTFVHDRQANTTEQISPINGADPRITGGGEVVVFHTLVQVHIFDRVAGTSQIVQGQEPSISEDGRFVAYSRNRRIFVLDRTLQTTTEVTLLPGGIPANGVSDPPKISGDGRYITFKSAASNLVPGDDSTPDLFLYDRIEGQFRKLGDGWVALDDAQEPDISNDGRFISFTSFFDGLVPEDTNGFADAFVFDQVEEILRLVSVGPDGQPANAGSVEPFLSGDGNFVVFSTDASNLLAGQSSPPVSPVVVDLRSGLAEAANVAIDGSLPGGINFASALSDDGSEILFNSSAANLVVSDTNNEIDAFLRDRQGTNRMSEFVSLVPNRQAKSIDFGTVAKKGSIAGQHFDDLIPNGIKDDGEPGIAGLTVYIDENGDGKLNLGERNTTTDSLGRYLFDDLTADASYRVATLIPNERELVLPAVDDGGVWDVYLPPAGELVDLDFGSRPISTGGQSQNGVISGRVFEDLNGDGVQNGGEQGMPGMGVFIDRNADGERQFDEPRTLTTTGGDYLLANLGSLAGAVRLEPAANQTQTNPRGNFFALSQPITVSARTQPGDPNELILADFNGDNRQDIAVALGLSNKVGLLINNGAGGFEPVRQIDLDGGLGPASLVAGQFNAAGSTDLAVANLLNNSVTILLDFDGATFTSTQNLDISAAASTVIGPAPSSIITVDIDGDTDLDLVTANNGADSVSILINSGGTFTLGDTLDSGGSDPFAVAAGDFDGVNGVDLVVANFGSTLGGDPLGSVGLLLRNSLGEFEAPRVFNNAMDGLGISPASLAVGDFVGDAGIDIAVANFRSNNVSLIQRNSQGEFEVLPANPTSAGPIDLTAVDIDSDLDLDIIVSSLSGGVGAVSVLRNRESFGEDGFEPSEVIAAASFVGTPVFYNAVGDVDGDQTPDLIVGDGNDNTINVQRNTIVNGGHQVALTGVEQLPGRNFALAVNLPGDYDGSGLVDGADHAFWKANFGATAGPGLAADGNNDGRVDAIDYAIWRENLGAGSAASQTAAAATTPASPAIADAALTEVTSDAVAPSLPAPRLSAQRDNVSPLAIDSTTRLENHEQLLLLGTLLADPHDPSEQRESAIQPEDTPEEQSAWDDALQSDFNLNFF